MSASIPKRITLDSLDGDGRGRAKWIALSILAHVLLLAWIFSLKTPAAQSALNDAAAKNGSDKAQDAAAQPTPLEDKLAASPERVEEVAKEINAIQADEVKDKVQELLSTGQQLAETRKEKLQDYSALARDLAKDAPQKTADALAAATQAQEAARQAQEAAVKAVTEFEQAKKDMAAATPENQAAAKQQVGTKEQETRDAQEKAKNAQSAATDAQTTAAQQLAFEGDAFAAAKKAQDDANAAQENANQLQDDASSKVNEVGWAEQTLRSRQNDAEGRQRAVTAAASQLENQKNALETAKLQAQPLADALEKAKAAAADAKAKLDQTPDKVKMGAMIASNRAGQEVVKAQTAIARQQDRITKMDARLQEDQQKLDDLKAKAARADEEEANAQTTAEQSPHKAVVGQQEALAAQQKAGELQAQAQGEIAKAGDAANKISQDTQPAETQPDTTVVDENLEGKNFAQLYQVAVDSEKKIAEQYKDIRAAESAKLRQVPISEAAKSIQVAIPVRPPLDPSIASANIQSAEALNVHNAAMEKALQQIDSMVATAQGIADQAQGQQQMNVSVEDMKVEAAEAGKLEQLAAENEGQLSVDVSQMMQQMEEGKGPHHEGGEGPDLGGSGTPGGNPMAGAAGTVPGGNPSDANGGQQGNAGDRNGRPGQMFAGLGGQQRGDDVAGSLPGRKVHAAGDGAGAKWMFIDSWYIIGPFPNPARRDIDTKFPPDSVIDLDASYPGKNGELVHWRFKQSPTAGIHPPEEQPYAIYYAYTTLWFDEPRDMWIAIGSDDFSKIWINDMLVWASGRVQKPWGPGEGFRKVHFKKGLNRILDRVENGQNGCMYSVMLNMQEK